MMSGFKYTSLRLGLRAAHMSGMHRAVGRWSQGLGAILTFHHVRPQGDGGFRPSEILEITPEFFEALLAHLRARNFDIIPLEHVPDRIRAGWSARRFIALTFDDGYRDNRDYALPILRRYDAPATVFVTKGFAEHTANMWWRDLEAIIRREDHLLCRIEDQRFDLMCRTVPEKNAAFLKIYWRLRALHEMETQRAVADLRATYPVDTTSMLADACMNWDELRAFARDPLIKIGAHTLTHPKLAGCDVETARHEIVGSEAAITRELGLPVHAFAYPFGDTRSAGPRELAMVKAAGFRIGVTTRPGMIFPEHRDYMTGLPRLSINGRFQCLNEMDVLLSGLPFAAVNLGRRVNVA
jgi:peptidoglycan/xylan/chitin deacetylase (PgdA/CDA1 family)